MSGRCRAGANAADAVTVLVSAADLGYRRRVVLLDVRWALGDDRGREKYLDGHLPGAVFVDLETELADPAVAARRAGTRCRRYSDCSRAARRWGIRAGDPVVAYDDYRGQAAARAWWLLRWGGLTDVRLLDGGLDAWCRAGGAVETGDVVPEPGDVVLTGGGMPVLSIDEAAALPASGRTARRAGGGAVPRRGRADRPSRRARPRCGERADDGEPRPRTAPSGRRRSCRPVRGAGRPAGRAVGVYCGSGVTAAHEVAALAVAGVEAALWPGSWSQWSADPARPVATGPNGA